MPVSCCFKAALKQAPVWNLRCILQVHAHICVPTCFTPVLCRLRQAVHSDCSWMFFSWAERMPPWAHGCVASHSARHGLYVMQTDVQAAKQSLQSPWRLPDRCCSGGRAIVLAAAARMSRTSRRVCTTDAPLAIRSCRQEGDLLCNWRPQVEDVCASFTDASSSHCRSQPGDLSLLPLSNIKAKCAEHVNRDWMRILNCRGK